MFQKYFLGNVFAERLNRTIRDLRKPVFQSVGDNCVDIVSTKTKKNNSTIHSSTKLTSIQTSLKKIERYDYHNLLHKRKEIKPTFQVNDLVRTADLWKTSPIGDTTNWSYKLYKFTESFFAKIPRFRIDNLPER